MPSIKRPSSDIEDFVQITPNKAARLDPKDARIKELDSQVVELHQFIIQEHMLMKVSPIIREQIQNHPGTSKRFESAIRAWITAAYEKSKGSTYHSEVASCLVQKYVTEIEQLAEMPEGLERAFNLILFLGEKSYDQDDTRDFCSYRPSDDPADTLLLKLAKRMKKKYPTFMPAMGVALLQSRIEQLKAKGVKTYFPNSYDLMWSWVGGPEAVREFHDDLKSEISSTYANILAEKGKRYERDYYSIGERMEDYVPRIQRLGRMASTGSELAFDLVLYLGRHSYLESPDNYRSPSNRRLDMEMDNLLMQLATAIKEDDPDFKPKYAVDSLRCEIEFLAENDIHSYFPKSFKLLSSWLPEAAKAYAGEIRDEIKGKISKAHRILEKRLEIYRLDQKRPTADWLGAKMLEFLEDIEKLSKMVEGLLPAIDLLVYLGECSYPKKEICEPAYGWSIEEYSEKRSYFELEVDTLLMELIERARMEDENFKPIKQTASLRESVDYLAGYKIRSYFPRSYTLMCNLV